MDLHFIWFVLISILFIAYTVLDGFDFGVGMVFYTAKTDREKRLLINTIGPVWDANEVWLVCAGGALFAAFPDVYATVFSGFYNAFILFLLVLIGRAVSIEFRGKVDSASWKKTWDFVFHLSSYLIVLLLAVAFGNIIQGLPIDSSKEFTGTFIGLLNPYSLMTAITAIALIRLHGRLFLLTKLDGELSDRNKNRVILLWMFFFILFLFITVWTFIWKQNLLKNYFEHTYLFAIPSLTIISIIMILTMAKIRQYFKSFFFSSLTIALLITQAAISIFPNLVPSITNSDNSLSVYNASSSESTLHTMFIIACIGLPLVIIYKIIMYSAFRGKVKIDSSSY